MPRDASGVTTVALLELSIAHVDGATAVALMTSGVDGVISYPKTPWGAFVPVPNAGEIDESAAPQALRDCLEYARRHGVAWLMFDVDGPKLQGLEVYTSVEGSTHVAA